MGDCRKRDRSRKQTRCGRRAPKRAVATESQEIRIGKSEGFFMYIPSCPCLTSSQLQFGEDPRPPLPYPLEEAGMKYFYVARNGIYHLFRALGLASQENVLVPNYHSGNETSAMRAAGVNIRFYPILRDLQPDFEA